MLKLILYDVRMHRGFLSVFGPIYPLYMGYFGSRMGSHRLFIILCAFTFAILPLSVIGREDRFKAIGFRLSLPVTRRDHILSRYLLGGGLMIALFAVTIVIMRILPGANPGVSSFLSARNLLQALAYMTLVFGGTMPLMIRFGMTGLLSMLIALQLLGVVALFISRDFIRVLKAVIGAVSNSIAWAESALGTAGAILAAILVLFVLNAMSFAISLALSKKKEF